MAKIDSSPKERTAYDKASAIYAAEYTSVSASAAQFLSYMPNSGRILEVGCGTGVDADYLAKGGYTVIATDISSSMIDEARRAHSHPNISFQTADLTALDFSDSEFDGLFAESCILHIPKLKVPSVFKGFHRVLAPGGILALGLQEGESQETFLPAPFLQGENVFVNVFSYKESHRLLTQAGFSIINEFAKKPRAGQHPFAKRKIFAKKNI